MYQKIFIDRLMIIKEKTKYFLFRFTKVNKSYKNIYNNIKT